MGKHLYYAPASGKRKIHEEQTMRTTVKCQNAIQKSARTRLPNDFLTGHTSDLQENMVPVKGKLDRPHPPGLTGSRKKEIAPVEHT